MMCSEGVLSSAIILQRSHSQRFCVFDCSSRTGGEELKNDAITYRMIKAMPPPMQRFVLKYWMMQTASEVAQHAE
jgi:hypothetical protein